MDVNLRLLMEYRGKPVCHIDEKENPLLLFSNIVEWIHSQLGVSVCLGSNRRVDPFKKYTRLRNLAVQRMNLEITDA